MEKIFKALLYLGLEGSLVSGEGSAETFSFSILMKEKTPLFSKICCSNQKSLKDVQKQHPHPLPQALSH